MYFVNFSDVPGDDISMVASGPTVKDATTNRDAAEILQKYDVLAMCELPSCKLLETPKEEKYFKNIHNILFVSAKQALTAMSERAEELGFTVKIFSPAYQGEAETSQRNNQRVKKANACWARGKAR